MRSDLLSKASRYRLEDDKRDEEKGDCIVEVICLKADILCEAVGLGIADVASVQTAEQIKQRHERKQTDIKLAIESATVISEST